MKKKSDDFGVVAVVPIGYEILNGRRLTKLNSKNTTMNITLV